MLPQILDNSKNIQNSFPTLDEREVDYITEAIGLFDNSYYSYSLLAIWNAAVNNLKRKVEAYGIDLWTSVVKDESGRKRYDLHGDTIAERWSNVDDLVLIAGATKLGLLNPKAGKSLEMINWMRNHASPAHNSDNRVEREDAIALILLLQKNLFEQQMPEPGHSAASIFDPIRTSTDLDFATLTDQIKSCKSQDLRNIFGFFLDLLTNGEEPATTNVKELFPVVWKRINEDLRKTLGIKYHTYTIDPNSDVSPDQGGKTRILEMLINLDAVKYIPDGTRAQLYRRAAAKLAQAKDTSYGWNKENSASKTLLQLGTSIPSVAFECVYQEILAAWCGNFWGKSNAHEILEPFITSLNTDNIRIILRMFKNNDRVKEELYQSRPKNCAIKLLKSFDNRLTIEAHKEELRDCIEFVSEL